MLNEAAIYRKNSNINWTTTIFIALFHVLAIIALFMFTWKALFVTIFLWWVTGSLGIGMGYHRLLTHRGYKTPKPIEYFLTLCGALTLEGGPIFWVATHRIHHAHTEETGKDPHTPREGAWWAHIGWMLRGTAQQQDQETLARYTPDLLKDRFHVWLNRWYFLPLIVLGFVLLAGGGWSVMMWGIFLRVTLGWHATWLVNSATHMWGTRRFETLDDSTNNLLIALITFGEGWHNNHHAHPTAARHGVAWYEIDINWWGIRALQLLGLAKSVKLISKTVPMRPAQSTTEASTASKAA
jgi:stearoyl-CoA desaturase (delta-9 desaturase)